MSLFLRNRFSKLGLCGLSAAGIILGVLVSWTAVSASPLYSYLGTTDIYDNTLNANAVDVEVGANSLADFKSRVAAAYLNGTGGVVDFTNIGTVSGSSITWLTAANANTSTAGKGGTETGELIGSSSDPIRVLKGMDPGTVLLRMLGPSDYHLTAPQIYNRLFNDSSTSLPAISGAGTTNKYNQDSLITTPRPSYINNYNAVNEPDLTLRVGEMWFNFLDPVGEIGITALGAHYHSNLARTTADYEQEVKAIFNDGTYQSLTSTISRGLAAGTDDTFFNIVAPSGKWITRLELRDTGFAGGTAYDDFGFILAPVPEPATWAMLVASGLFAGFCVRRRF